MEREPDIPSADDEDLFGDPDEVDVSIEEELDERLEYERDSDEY